MMRQTGVYLGLLASILTTLVGHYDVLGPDYKGIFELLGLVGVGISGWLATSPFDRDKLPTLLLACAIAGAIFSTGCAPKAYHLTTASVATAHGVLATVQDTAFKLKCGAPDAPPAPNCLEGDVNVQVHAALVKGFDAEVKVARAVRAWPVGTPMPAEIPGYLAEVTKAVNEALDLLPAGKLKDWLVAHLKS